MDDDRDALTELNLQFIDAFRHGSWERLQPVLSPSFRYLDGASGELWEMARYIADLQDKPVHTIAIDQLVVHIGGDAAVISARSSVRPGQFNRYVDSYERRDGRWACYAACVWPLSTAPDKADPATTTARTSQAGPSPGPGGDNHQGVSP